MKPGSGDGAERPEFQAFLEESIEEGLRYVLGESGVKMVLSEHPLEEISSDPSKLHEALKGIFLENGAALIEREIALRLLDRMGSARDGARRSKSSWLGAGKTDAGVRGRASARERKVLRQFMALASLPKGHPTGAELDPVVGSIGTGSIELTSLEFASAFKKGS